MQSQRQVLYQWINDLVTFGMLDKDLLVATSDLMSINTQICSDRLKLRWPAKQKKVKTSEVVVMERGKPTLQLHAWADQYYDNCLCEIAKTLRHLTKVLGPQVQVRAADNRAPSSPKIQDWIDSLHSVSAGWLFEDLRRIDDNYYVIHIEDLQKVVSLVTFSRQR